MNHTFQSSMTDSNKCAYCKYNLIQHSNMAECECCSNIGPVNEFMTMLMCPSCIEKERNLQLNNTSPSVVEQRVNSMNILVEKTRAMDNSIQVRTDIFNASTTAIIDLKKSIDADEGIINKPYTLAEILTNRFKHFKEVIFEANETIINAANEQKAIQIYLNNLANQLRAEEREKLKIADINYNPPFPKKIEVKKIRSVTKKIDKVELKRYASELGLSEFTLQMLVVSKGLTVEQAANLLRKTINEAKSEIK